MKMSDKRSYALSQLKPYTLKKTDPMKRAFKSSHLKYQLHLESEKKKERQQRN